MSCKVYVENLDDFEISYCSANGIINIGKGEKEYEKTI